MTGKGRGANNKTSDLAAVGAQHDVDHPNSTLLVELKQMFGSFTNNFNQYDRLSARCDKLTEQYDLQKSELFEVKQNYDKVLADNIGLREEVKGLKQQIAIMNNHVDEQEMSQRLACLVVSNMPEERNVSDEDAFIELCNSKLRMSENISKADIANVSRLKRSSGTSAKPSMMVIRFQNQKAREKVFKHKKNLKHTGKVISEFLTPRKSALLKECHDKIPGTFSDRSIWTHHGKILIKKVGSSDTPIEIKGSGDIGLFLQKYKLVAREPES